MISSCHREVVKVLQVFFVFVLFFGWNYQLRVLVTYLALIGTTLFISVGLAYGIFEVIRTQAWETP